MEITASTIYWVTRADNFHGLCLSMGLALSIIGGLICLCELGYMRTHKTYYILSVPIIGLFFLLLACFIPSTKTIAAMYVLPKIVNNEQIQQIPSKLLDLSNEWLEELRPKKEK